MRCWDIDRIDVLHPDDAERCRVVYEKAFEQREPFQMEHRLRRHDGDYGWVVTVGVPRYDVDGSFAGYIGTGVDIIERKLAEEALSAVSQKLIEAHEEERARIARELHDDINQRLALASVRLGYLKQSPPASAADIEQEIGTVSQEIADLVADIQALSHGLHPARLELLGLERAAAAFCEELSNRQDLTIDAHFENIPKALPRELSLCLYRVLQEALQNVVKHGESRHARVSLNGHIDTIDLTVEDSGAGFDPHEAMRGPGLGLTSMKERLKAIGGQLAVHSQPGARHDDSRCRASLPPDEACDCRSMSFLRLESDPAHGRVWRSPAFNPAGPFDTISPCFMTQTIRRVLRMSRDGSAASSTRSARRPASTTPTSDRRSARAALSPVIFRISFGVSPASAAARIPGAGFPGSPGVRHIGPVVGGAASPEPVHRR